MTRPLLAYYGDDFTGSTDVMEVLQWAGVRTVLFLKPPSREQLASFENLKAFGIAGRSRSMSPLEMEQELKPAFKSMRDSGAQFVHYKVCSTGDSSPDIGSIGKAIELGREVFGPAPVPLLIAAPHLGRYQAFGNLFARSGLDSEPYRLDRHPTMIRHPVTPMGEADLRLHLAKQTNLRIGLLDLLCLQELSGQMFCPQMLPEGDVLLCDAVFPEHLPRIGEVIQELAEPGTSRFVVGSSGVESALSAFWKENGQLESLQSHSAGSPTFPAAEQLLVITGSCSPVTDRQTAWGAERGFRTLALNTARLIHPETSQREIEGSVERALNVLWKGENLILHSSRGPNDPRIVETLTTVRSQELSDTDSGRHSGRLLGPKLGQILRRILEQRRVERIGIAGGDTSGDIARELKITALEAIAPAAPGSPLCRIHADNSLNGIEAIFKGGQVGKDDIWGTLLHGTDVRAGRSPKGQRSAYVG